MRLHRNISFGITSGLRKTLVNQIPASDVIRKILKSNSKWGARDRKIIAKIFYEIIRQKRLIKGALGIEYQKSEMTFLYLIAGWMILNGFTLPNWEEFKHINIENVKKKAIILMEIRKFKYSIPDWLDEMGINSFGEKIWNSEIKALNQPAKLIIRVNTIIVSVDELKLLLKKKYQIETKKINKYDDALIFDNHRSLQDIKEYQNGFFEVQDANSQAIVPWLKPEPGKYYIDSCAGAGGKSLHLASLTNDKAEIMSLDIRQSKLNILKKRALRNRIKSIRTKFLKSQDEINDIKGNADGLLIDAPCSGLGVLKRNPETKWLINEKQIKEIVLVQENILLSYSKLVKEGGFLVYATCSIFPVENRNQIEKFLKTDQGLKFQFDVDKTYFSHNSGFDGFYCARLVKKCE